jgi:hypothetical protein
MKRVIEMPTMTEEEWQQAKAWTDEEWARVVLPPGWKELPIRDGDIGHGARMATRGKTSLMFSVGAQDGKRWLHVSIAHPEKMPSYLDLAEVKAIFIGKDRQAVQIFPAVAEHVNLHGRALHLWACLEPEGDGLPHFGSEGTI